MLFDDNLGFITFDLNNNYNTSNKKELEDSKTAFLKGNIVKNEYKPYKNYTFRKLEAASKKEQLMLEIMELCFVINDLNLLLDLDPDNNKLNKLFQDYVIKSYEKELEYVNNYGPLELKEVSGNEFNWIDNPWPWDKDGATYV